jgi:hypothetical protein
MPGQHMRISAGLYDLFNKRPTSSRQPTNRARIDTHAATLLTTHGLGRSIGLVLPSHPEFISRRMNHHVTEQLHSSHKRPLGERRRSISPPPPRRDHRAPHRLRRRCRIAHILRHSPLPYPRQNSRPSKSPQRVISGPCPRSHSPATMMNSSSVRQVLLSWECKGGDD